MGPVAAGWDQPPIIEITSAGRPVGRHRASRYELRPPCGRRRPRYAGVTYGGQIDPAGLATRRGGDLAAGHGRAGPPAARKLPLDPRRGGRRPAARPRRRRRYAAYQVLNGGGTQPDEVVPATAIAFAKLDLNPSAAQKIAAARFLSRLPKLAPDFSSAGDWRKPLFDALANGRCACRRTSTSIATSSHGWASGMAVAVLPPVTETDGTDRTRC